MECALRYWDLTPEEFAIHVECWHRREARAWDRLAVIVCQVTAPYRKKKLTPAEFLGRPLSGMKRTVVTTETAEDG